MRFGGRRRSALWVAIPVGALVSSALAALAAVVVATGGAGSQPVVGAVVIVALTLAPCVGFAWVAVVDRSTLRGTTEQPEQSVEARWFERATSGALTDTLLIVGLGTAVLAFTRVEIPTLIALAAVLLIAMGSVAVRYLAQQRRG
jgi:hypothetical protein